MAPETSEIDTQIERLRNGGTLSELEVKNLCEKVSYSSAEPRRWDLSSTCCGEGYIRVVFFARVENDCLRHRKIPRLEWMHSEMPCIDNGHAAGLNLELLSFSS
jgi:hypothetical protein